ncbi:hypothetical protein ASPZODRAFT_139600 [Penicilliopsis zonata CBS 506.65]|uniref:DJ-1/PfpI domain-containing protein n=1 Tax=Penicilliopsis zonata CBS 506.65 TaxID=1073090 RepID=A0A1L9SSX2_9EURO|nr:hypothetical protein ASPZODRAFT_139600 [Penicilliopsis zonata CBS 506.65]OJJ50289.1 hypothetical protein ASPZODRAFT_139600 [Penicilliopsis zonata CBS 506.65]
MASPIPVAIVLFEGIDVLDFNGPLEILSNASYTGADAINPDLAFDVKLVAASEVVHSRRNHRYIRDYSFEEATSRLDEFRILVVPGGSPSILLPLLRAASPELEFVKRFLNHPNSTSPARTIFSVCTGALFLAAAGALADMTATTHHTCFDMLREMGEDPACGKINVVKARYVDGGRCKTGVRVLTAGGVSSGLDAACYLVSTEVSQEAADRIAAVVEYDWRREPEQMVI